MRVRDLALALDAALNMGCFFSFLSNFSHLATVSKKSGSDMPMSATGSIRGKA